MTENQERLAKQFAPQVDEQPDEKGMVRIELNSGWEDKGLEEYITTTTVPKSYK